MTINQAVIYVESDAKAMWLRQEMEQMGFTLSVKTTDMSQDERCSMDREFRSGSTRCMILTAGLQVDSNIVSVILMFDSIHSEFFRRLEV